MSNDANRRGSSRAPPGTGPVAPLESEEGSLVAALKDLERLASARQTFAARQKMLESTKGTITARQQQAEKHLARARSVRLDLERARSMGAVRRFFSGLDPERLARDAAGADRDAQAASEAAPTIAPRSQANRPAPHGTASCQALRAPGGVVGLGICPVMTPLSRLMPRLTAFCYHLPTARRIAATERHFMGSRGLDKADAAQSGLSPVSGGSRSAENGLRTAEQGAQAPAPSSRAPQGSACRVLIVDDSAPVAELFAALLADMGHEVQVALDGPAALERVATFRPDIVFSDISMPRMDGYELVQRLRARTDLDGVRYVAMTGFGRDTCDRALQAGFHHHMTKPVDMTELESLLEEISGASSEPSRRLISG